MKNILFIGAIFLFACGPSSEKIELLRLRDSIRIINTINGGAYNLEVQGSEYSPTAVEKEKLQESAKRTADSIADAINASMG